MLGNSHVKLVGGNSPTTLSILAREMGISLEQLQSVGKFQFMTQSGNAKPIKIHTNRHLAFRFYQLDKIERKKLRKYILESGQYVDIQKNEKQGQIQKEEWGNEIQKKNETIVSDSLFENPTPKFTF